MADGLKPKSGSYDNSSYEQSPMYYYRANGTIYAGPYWYDSYRFHDSGQYSGCNIPHYHRRLKAGELLPHTPFQQFIAKGTQTGGPYTAIWKDGRRFYSPGYIHNSPWSWVPTESDCASYLPNEGLNFVQLAAAKIYSSSFDLSTFISEMREVVPMWQSFALRMRGLEVPRSWRNLNNDWLAFRYGWRPLMSDLHGLYQIIFHYEDRLRHAEKQGTHYASTHSESAVQSYTYNNVTSTKTDSVQVGIRGSVTADIRLPRFQINPVTTAWELLRYSFIVDWFLSVGSAIAATSFLALQSNYSASYGYRVEISRTISSSADTPKSTLASISNTTTSFCSAVLEHRVPCKVPTYPHLTFKIDSHKVIDLLAILSGKFRRK